MPEAENLVAHVRDRRVVVVGASPAGLVAAWECARVGLTVTLLDGADRLGGSLAPGEINGVAVEGAYADFAAGDPEVGAVLHLLGIDGTDAVAEVGLGIPPNPWAEEVRRAIGWSGTWRAYLDRIRPPLTIGREPSLGALVRRRMGHRVADRLVAPRAAARWETPIDDLDADRVLPGISSALTRTGSLSGAVAQLAAEDAPQRQGLRGGFAPFIAALETHLRELGADVRTAHTVSLVAATDGGWSVTAHADVLDADAVIIATGTAEAQRLLADFAVDTGEVDEVDVITLLVDVADQRDLGPDVLSVTEAASASGGKTLRVVLAGANRDDDTALAAASGGGTVRGFARSCRVAAGTGYRVHDHARTDTARAALAAPGGLYAVGGWLAGGDLADQIADAVRTAEQVRHDLLWTAEPGLATS